MKRAGAFMLAALLLARLPAAAGNLRRPPAVAGTFYPADPSKLEDLVRKDLAAAPKPKLDGTLAALLVPHAGLEFSGPTAAKSFQSVNRGDYDEILVIGTGHYKAIPGAALYPGDYGTPEGYFPYGEALAKRLMKASSLIVPDPEAHAREHSIEVELPFLQERLGQIPLVGLLMNTDDLETAKTVGAVVAKALRETKRRVLIVASSDQSHYPPAAFDDAVDRTTLRALETLRPDYFWLASDLWTRQGVPHLAVAYCGQAAVTAVMAAASALGTDRVRILGHANSFTALPAVGTERVVGYAAAAFVKTGKRSPPPWPFEELDLKEKSTLLRAARESLEKQALSGAAPSAQMPADNPLFNLPAASFVTLTEKGALRGCIGSLKPREPLLLSVIHNAALAGSQDPRFTPVQPSELPRIDLEISILSLPRRVMDAGQVHRGEGVILSAAGNSGVFLPQVWDKLPQKEAFLGELCVEKAGLARDCWKDPKTRIETFAVTAFSETGTSAGPSDQKPAAP